VSDSTSTTFDASRAWRLSPDVSLRDESFGALAYHHGNRRLVFLKSEALVALVGRLDQFASADEALDALDDRRSKESYRRALHSLADAGIIRGR
jgi:putative mycofactocin binding protein MftB